ncbi:putative uncharacterized protein DDB_G0272516, partial [Drosophila innubila]|uniref:putative uncharacterized protein DDB_G0272516 n=1 Tax=Drosophila innubila TaxID=198719 RepID=UPI00148DC2F2
YYRKPQKYRNDEHPTINNNNIRTNATTAAATTTRTTINNYNYLENNRCSNSHVSNSNCNSNLNLNLSLNSNYASLDHVQEQQQHYNNNYYYYYNYNLSYAPPPAAPHECLLGGPKGRLQQLKRRTRHELQQWPLLMQLVVLLLWLHGKFWQIIREHILMHRRRWH